jgi:hypothetical protein
MQDAYAASAASALAGRVSARIVETTVRPERPTPIVSAPDVRLAFIYEWIDNEGNLHFPNWIAIPVEPFKWVLPELGRVPMDGSRSERDPATFDPPARSGNATSR